MESPPSKRVCLSNADSTTAPTKAPAAATTTTAAAATTTTLQLQSAVADRVPSNFLSSREVVEEGDTVIVYVNFGTTYPVKLKRGRTLNMRYGALKHEYMIGKKYGQRVSATAGYVYLLRPTPELWTRALPHRTQILYEADCAMVTLMLDLCPAKVVVESGTGSGSLTHAMARTVAPTGHVYTFDIDQGRVDAMKTELIDHRLDDVVTVEKANACVDGFGDIVGKADAVFLDLPNPWLAVEHAKRALRTDKETRLVSFSPCIEQVHKTVKELSERGFVVVETVELVTRSWKVVEMLSTPLKEYAKGAKEYRGPMNKGSGGVFDAVPYPAQQPTHTGYLTSASLLPI